MSIPPRGGCTSSQELPGPPTFLPSGTRYPELPQVSKGTKRRGRFLGLSRGRFLGLSRGRSRGRFRVRGPFCGPIFSLSSCS